MPSSDVAEPSNLYYLRSTDNGETFDAVRSLHASNYLGTGLYLAAKDGNVALAWAYNWSYQSSYGLQIICSTSNDNGETFVSKTGLLQRGRVLLSGLTVSSCRAATSIYSSPTTRPLGNRGIRISIWRARPTAVTRS